jgi:NAD(P)-dependent dehydrogenase (short-subunit alcohol dehydrogenase family)
MAKERRSVRGKVVAITGAARGIGYAIAQRLLSDGARVAIGDIDEPRLAAAAASLGAHLHAQLDVTDRDGFATFLDLVEERLGPLDVLVNNAGIMPLGRLHEEDDATTRRVLDINVLGVVYGTKLALHSMLPRGRGHVINITSLAGESFIPGAVSYATSKHAVKAFTESVRREYRGSGVDISQVMPIYVNTELIAGARGVRLLPNAEPEQVAAAVARLIARPKPRVWVTPYAGMVVTSQNAIPWKAGDLVSRLIGADRNFIEAASNPSRRGYEERIRVN